MRSFQGFGVARVLVFLILVGLWCTVSYDRTVGWSSRHVSLISAAGDLASAPSPCSPRRALHATTSNDIEIVCFRLHVKLSQAAAKSKSNTIIRMISTYVLLVPYISKIRVDQLSRPRLRHAKKILFVFYVIKFTTGWSVLSVCMLPNALSFLFFL